MIQQKKWFLLLLYLITCASMPSLIFGNTPSTSLSIENEFIKLIVNDSPEDKGRFSLETTLGDPDKNTDDFQPIIYGRPLPWTSYTTLRIDNKNYIFGGKSNKTQRRVQDPLAYGQIKEQFVSGNAIITTTEFSTINVTQRLSFLRNPSTRVNDIAKISYKITNTDSVTHNIGLRIMLDTKLGSNDGAPFRIGSTSIVSEKHIEKKDLIDIWQAFDSLSSPNIIAQGLLSSFEHLISPPDDLYLVNWGTLVDHPWEFNYLENRSFIREGEFEKDTALALYWNPVTLKPNESKVFSTAYGLGGISLAPGELGLGVSAPSEYFATSKQPFFIIVYAHNKGGFNSQKTTISVTLPKGLTVLEGSLEKEFDNISPDTTVQFPIKVSLNNKATPGDKEISVKIKSETLEANQVSRPITFLAPPSLTLKLMPPVSLPLNQKGTPITLSITNPYDKPIHNVSAKLTLPSTLSLLSLDINKKTLPILNPKETIVMNWFVEHTATKKQTINYTATIQADEMTAHNLTSQLFIIPFQEKVSLLKIESTPLQLNTPSIYDLKLQSVSPSDNILKLVYDSDAISILSALPNASIPSLSIEKGQNTLTFSSILETSPSWEHIVAHLYVVPKSIGKTDLYLYKNNELDHVLSLDIKEETK